MYTPAGLLRSRPLVVGVSLAALLLGQAAHAAARPCTISVDPAGDVDLANGDHIEDPSRDITRVTYHLTTKELVVEVRLVDLLDQPSKSLGDFLALQFRIGGDNPKYFLIEASRRLANTGTPRNSNYAKQYPEDDVKVQASWNASTNIVRVAIDRATATKRAGAPVGAGTMLGAFSVLTAPALTDEGTPAWADFAGKAGTNNRGVDVRLLRC